MRKTMACLLLGVFWVPSWASDHGRFLDKRMQGEIAPFEKILSAARTVVGHHAVLLDARFVVKGSQPVVRVFFHRINEDIVVVVTVNAANANVIDTSGEGFGKRNAPQSKANTANSRPNGRSKSFERSGAKGKTGGKNTENNDVGGRGHGHGGKGNGGKSGGGKGGSGKK